MKGLVSSQGCHLWSPWWATLLWSRCCMNPCLMPDWPESTLTLVCGFLVMGQKPAVSVCFMLLISGELKMGLRKTFWASRIFRYVLLLIDYYQSKLFWKESTLWRHQRDSCHLKCLQARLVGQFLGGLGFLVGEWNIYSFMHSCMPASYEFLLCTYHKPDTVLDLGV